MFYTYAHYKPDNSVFYIRKGHCARAWSTKDRNPHWRRIVAKHGAHKVEILAQWPTEQEAFAHEIFLIKTFREMGAVLANVTAGGEGTTGMKHSPEVRARMSKVRSGKTISPAHIAAIRKATLGRKHTEEVKAYLSKLNRERVLSEEQLDRIRSAHKGKPKSAETKKKLSIARTGSVMSAEHRAIMSAVNKGKKQSPEHVQKRIASRLATLKARQISTERQ